MPRGRVKTKHSPTPWEERRRKLKFAMNGDSQMTNEGVPENSSFIAKMKEMRETKNEEVFEKGSEPMNKETKLDCDERVMLGLINARDMILFVILKDGFRMKDMLSLPFRIGYKTILRTLGRLDECGWLDTPEGAYGYVEHKNKVRKWTGDTIRLNAAGMQMLLKISELLPHEDQEYLKDAVASFRTNVADADEKRKASRTGLGRKIRMDKDINDFIEEMKGLL